MECKVVNQKHEIIVAAPFDQNIVNCNEEETPHCSGRGIFTSHTNENYTSIKVRTETNDVVEGEWSCQHGSIVKKVMISFADGNMFFCKILYRYNKILLYQ